MNKFPNIHQPEKKSITEAQAYKVRHIFNTNKLWKILGFTCALLMIIFLFVPLISVDLLITEESLSIFDILSSKSDSKAVSDMTSCIVSADSFVILIKCTNWNN